MLRSNSQFDPDKGELGWGWAPRRWQNSVGSVLVVRQDKKALSPLHVEALCNYCRYEVGPVIAHSVGDYYPEEPISKDGVLAMICRPTFVIYWFKLLDEKDIEEDGEGADEASPYEV